MGFDRIWAVEHHALRWYAHMSAPEIFLTWVAARTSRIRIGHGVVCMPFNYNHPVRTAERAAMLDNLSGGRLDLGAGRGATLQEMSLFGVQAADTYPQVEETLRILGQCWRDEVFEWHSDQVDITPHPILPRPVQEPHPPFFLACTKNETVALAGELGIGALVLGFAGPDDVAGMRKTYDEAIGARTGDRFVTDRANDHFSALCPTIVLDDAGDALKVGARGQRFFAEAITHWYGAGPPPSLDTADVDNVAEIKHSGERLVARLHEADIPYSPNTTAIYNAEHAYGDASTAIEYVQRLVDTGADEIMCLIQMGTVPQAACLETIRQWGAKVIPYFRSRA